MFDILRIELTNFRTYAGAHTFTFPKESGLYLLTGKNKANPRLGKNATGKSTLLEAIHWCFYGCTSRGLKAGRVLTRGKKSCGVSVQIKIAGFEDTITRTQSPNSLKINNTNVEQRDVTKLLRLSPEQFTLAVMLPQFGDSFLDLKPTDKLALFSQIMELDFWLEKSKAADALAKELAEAKEAEARNFASVSGKISSVHEDCRGLEAHKNDFSSLKKSEVQKIRAKILAAQNDSHLLDEEMTAANAGLVGSLEKAAKIATVIRDNQGKIDTVIAERQRLATKAAVLEASLQTMHISFKKLSELEATCPTCLQTVNASHLKAEKARLKGQIDTAELAFEAYEESINKLAEERTAIAKATSSGHDNLAAVTRNKVDFETKISVLKNKIGHNNLHLEQLEGQTEQERKRENPYISMLADKRAALTDLKAKRAECKAQIATLNEDHAAVSYWVQGFKRVRLFLVEETLRQLELEVNNNLASLGLLDWRIEFDVERENKAGGLTKGFVAFVHCPDWTDPVQFEEWSGGETQRLRLAGDLGLANLIMERAGLTGMIEFYDEPSKHMSTEGLLDLAETLHQRAIDSGKRIYLVDHNLIDFAGVLTAIKDKNGSRLEFAL